MADNALKKIIIPNNQLPFITFTTEYNETTERQEIDDLFYAIRYRIVSEDRNRRSHWSPVSKIIMPDVTTPFPYTSSNRVSVEKNSNHVDVIWSFPTDLESPSEYEKSFRDITVFDIWTRWNTSNTTDPEASGWTEWEFNSTVSGNIWSTFPDPALDYKSIEVAIQVPTLVKLRDYNNNKLTLFKGIKQSL
jgi:hypothetical protein